MRVLGIDYGKNKIGLSISAGSIALPLIVIKNYNQTDLLNTLQKIIAEEKIEKIIVGIPLNFDRHLTSQSKEVAEFTRWLSQELSVPVEMIDETLSSKMASEQQIEGDDDAQAAANILQLYLDNLNHNDA